MRYRHGCGPRGHIEIDLPDAVMAMRGGRGWGGQWGPFHFDFGDGPEGRGRPGRRSRRMFESGELRLVLLKLIADSPRHGYDCIRQIDELTGGEYAPSPGVIYPTLNLLTDEGLIEQLDRPGVRLAYAATDAGRAHLEERSDEVEALFQRLQDLKPSDEHATGPAIGRAVKNLMTALSHRIGRDGLDEELLHEIAAILDESAQRIERVK
ncbi:PadR family transcriptional regulator [Sphingomonas sp. URHD0057]|uniref:PadR family transcriptional regulator n=1 Tax=Sphingomonas sp. URHD0057 TaxID=1380389 RepID=UPI00048BFC4F|nr:PadR family transcriptional regulator [Sphingomonas sp. URHD0057]